MKALSLSLLSNPDKGPGEIFVFYGVTAPAVLKGCIFVLFLLAVLTPFDALAEDTFFLRYSGKAGAAYTLSMRDGPPHFIPLNTTEKGFLLAEDLSPTSDHETVGAEEDLQFDDEFEEGIRLIADPIESFNRGTFYVNDKLYLWIFRPIALGYGYVMPEKARVGVRKFFTNLAMPMRFVNDVLQFKFKFAGIEMARFLINTTVGVVGFSDPAEKWFHLYLHKEDFGQTLGFYGLGPGIYINWPFFGPSSIRGTVGMVGDLFLNPLTYLFPENRAASVGIYLYDMVNETSLNVGIYEQIKKESLDPYVFIRNAYHQHRESAIKE